MVVAMISSNIYFTISIFLDFNEYLQAIFSQLSFENFWLYVLGARLFWLKIIKNDHKSRLKVYEWKIWVK